MSSSGRRDPSPARAGSTTRWSTWRRRSASIPETANRHALLSLLRADAAPGEAAGLAPGAAATTRSSRSPSARCAWSRGWPTRRRWCSPGSCGGIPTMPRRATGSRLRCAPAHDGEGRAQWRCRPRSSRRGCASSSTAQPYQIVDFQHVKPGKGGAFVRTKLKHMRQGKVIDNTFRAGEKVELVEFEEKHMQFLYKDDRYNFMDTETYEQLSLSADEVGDARDYLKENIEVDVLYIDGSPADGRAAELRRAGHRPHRPRRPRRHRPGRDQARHAGDRRRRPGAALPERGRRREGRHAHRRLPRPRRGRRLMASRVARRPRPPRRAGGRRASRRADAAPGRACSRSWDCRRSRWSPPTCACACSATSVVAPAVTAAGGRRAGGRNGGVGSPTRRRGRRRPRWSRWRRRWSAPSIAPPRRPPTRTCRRATSSRKARSSASSRR